MVHFMAKFELKIKACKLRKTGKSIKWIAKHIGVSSGSVSLWCRNIELAPEQIAKITMDRIAAGYAGRMKGAMLQKQKRLNMIENYRIAGLKTIGKFSKRELFIFGLGIYAGEGYKSGKRAGITNSDPAIINLMMKWFREICNVSNDNFSCEVGINEIHKNRVKSVVKYWSKITNIPSKSFTKTSLKKVKNKKVYKNKNSHFGTLAIRIKKSSGLAYEILGWLHAIFENKYDTPK